MKTTTDFFPAEWVPQSGVQLTWPDAETDWMDILDEVLPVYEEIAKAILKYEKLLVVCRNKALLPDFLRADDERIIVREMPINDTWARDHAALTIVEEGEATLLNFRFNGWGMKFGACHDNQITPTLFDSGAFQEEITMSDYSYFTLEGGALESNNAGCILTTSECLLSKNRNEHLSKTEIDQLLKNLFYAEKILWLDHGFLAGDDTDSHIDTLARFCNEDTIAYVKCDNENDIHFEALKAMEAQLKEMTDVNGKPFQLVPLPFPNAIYDENQDRLPATYANFLIINKAIIFPVYGVPQDDEAVKVAQILFPDREIIPVNAVPLIKQHGSIHCISMQFPEGVL